MTTDAETSRAYLSGCHRWVLVQIVKHDAAICIEMCYRSFARIFQAARATGVVEGDDRAG
jgi:hypothetical protein